MTTAVTNFCSADMRAFETVDGKGMKDIIETSLVIKAVSTDCIKVNDVLSNLITVRRNIETRAKRGHAALSVVLKRTWRRVSASRVFSTCGGAQIRGHRTCSSRCTTSTMISRCTPAHCTSKRSATRATPFKTGGQKGSNISLNVFRPSRTPQEFNCCGPKGIPSEFTSLACIVHKLATIVTTVVNKTT